MSVTFVKDWNEHSAMALHCGLSVDDGDRDGNEPSRAEHERLESLLVLVRAVNLMLGSAREIQSFARTCSARLEMLVACGLVAYKTFLRALVCAFCMLHAESLFL